MQSGSVQSSGLQFLPQDIVVWVLPIVACCLIACVCVVAPHEVLSERGTIERASVVFWFVGAWIAGAAAWLVRSRRYRSAALWLGLAAVVAAARELDLQKAMNPKYLGSWGVRFRVDWWLGNEASVGLRLLWIAVFVVVGVAVYRLLMYTVGSLRDRDGYAAENWIAVVRRSLGLKLLLLAFALLLAGWGCDDILRGRLHEIWGAMVEESLELLGAAVYPSAVGVLWREWAEACPPSVRPCMVLVTDAERAVQQEPAA